MSTSSDDEIAADPTNGDNKHPCVVETALVQCQNVGFDEKSLDIFQGQLEGRVITIKFFKNSKRTLKFAIILSAPWFLYSKH